MNKQNQKNIATHIGVSPAMYSAVKKGNRRFGDKICKKLSSELGISFEFLKTAENSHIIIAIEAYFYGKL